MKSRGLSKDSTRSMRSWGSSRSGGSDPFSPRSPVRMKSRRLSKDSTRSMSSWGSIRSDPSSPRSPTVREIVDSQTKLRDESEFFPATIIFSAIFVATCSGVAAFTLHLSVQLAGCLGGINGCQKSVILDMIEPLGKDGYLYGISLKSLYFIISSGLSGLCCSLVIYSPLKSAAMCKGGGSSGTKIAISAGRQVSIWVVALRIALAALYMGGGNTLGTEGPIIHVATALATNLIWVMGGRRRKLLSMFGVIGAAAGISAGFNLLVTGFIFTTEEITRSLSRKLALILALAAAVAMFVAHSLEDLLQRWLHSEHVSLVPPHRVWAQLTVDDVHACLVLCIPIGMLNGVAGWVFTRLAWAAQESLKPPKVGKQHPGPCHIKLPVKSHLAIIGLICGGFGAVAYELTGMNGVWGTTAGAIPEAIAKDLTWDKVLILFVTKFFSFILATAGGGPGGQLVPSLVTGGFMGLAVGLIVGGSEALSSACAVVGMGSLFASVMHLPVSGIIIVFELTRSPDLIMPVVIANFVSSNMASRLPGGESAFVHRNLDCDPTWLKLGKQDFIETDEQEHLTDNVLSECKIAFKEIFKPDSQRKREAFDAWSSVIVQGNNAEREEQMEARFTMGMDSIYDQIFQASQDMVFLHMVWSAWHTQSVRGCATHASVNDIRQQIKSVTEPRLDALTKSLASLDHSMRKGFQDIRCLIENQLEIFNGSSDHVATVSEKRSDVMGIFVDEGPKSPKSGGAMIPLPKDLIGPCLLCKGEEIDIFLNATRLDGFSNHLALHEISMRNEFAALHAKLSVKKHSVCSKAKRDSRKEPVRLQKRKPDQGEVNDDDAIHDRLVNILEQNSSHLEEFKANPPTTSIPALHSLLANLQLQNEILRQFQSASQRRFSPRASYSTRSAVA